MTSFGAILDTNVLITFGPRDTLLRAAQGGLYRPYWSESILEEVERVHTRRMAQRGRPDATAKAKHLVAEIRLHFPEAIVTGYEPLIPAMTNDPKDRHVLAAAVVGQAQVIITANLRHFPASALTPYRVEAQAPDVFLADLFDLYPERLIDILIQQGDDLNPPQTLEQTLDRLAREVPRFVQEVRSSPALPPKP